MSTDENCHIYTNEKYKNKKSDAITTIKHTLENDYVSASIYKCESVSTPALKIKNNVEEPLNNSEIDYSNVEQHLYGPVLPEHLRNSIKEFDDKSKANNLCDSSISDSAKMERIFGPEIPNHLFSTINSQEEKSSDTDEFFGPSTSLMVRCSDEMPTISSKSFTPLRDDPNTTTVKRESWMLELPSQKVAAFGIGPRQFKSRDDDEKYYDRSSWTETPADKARRRNQIDSKNDKNVMRLKQLEEKDRMLEKLSKKARKKNKRKESLLEIHKRKVKRQAKKQAAKTENEKKPLERRPFNRNTDLSINRFDLSQKKAIINKAQLLNNRFRQGESKFL